MRYDVKKYLFVGTADERDLFFEEMQRLGIVDFINMNPAKGKEIPQEIQNTIHSIKIVLGLPTMEQEDRNDYDQADSLISKILGLKHRIEILSEEQRVNELEISRIHIYGHFNLQDLTYIERKGNRKLQFFCAKQGHELKETDHLIYIGSDHGLDYYFSVNKHPVEQEDLIEMHFVKSLSDLEKRKREIVVEIEQAEEELKSLAKYNTYLHHCLAFKLNRTELEAHKHFTREALDQSLFVVEGWIPVHKVEMVSAVLRRINVYAEEVAIEEKDKIPTFLENSGTAAIGEDIIHIYDTPSHEDKDPSMWVLCSFAFFFAMIIGDAGYGLVFLAVALYLNYKFGKQAKGGLKRFLKLATILTTACVVWGTLMSSFFGISPGIDSHLRKVSLLHWLVEKKAQYHYEQKDDVYREWAAKYPEAQKAQNGDDLLHKAVTVRDEVIQYDMLDNFSRSVMLELALLTGIIHIGLSFARYLGRNWNGIGWILALLGGYLYFPTYLGATSMPHYAFGLPPEFGAQEGLVLMAGGFGLAVILSVVKYKLAGLAEIASVIQVFADVLSYLRLYALALAGAIMSQTINEMSGALPFVFSVLLIVLAHIVNMGLGIMGGVIHGLRLNFLEWYHYSFEGGGKLFKPLRLLDVE